MDVRRECVAVPIRPGVTREWAWASGVSGVGSGGSKSGACLDDPGGAALPELLSHGLQLLSLHLQLRGVVGDLTAVFFTDLHRALPLDFSPFRLELNAYRRLLIGHFLLGLGCGDAKFFEAGGTRGLKLGPSRPYLLPRCFLLAVECPLGRRHVGRHADDRRHLPAAHGALNDDSGLGAVVGLHSHFVAHGPRRRVRRR